MSYSEARYGFIYDASGNISTNYYLLSDPGYGYMSSGSTASVLGDVDMYAVHLDIGSLYSIFTQGSTDYANLYNTTAAIDPNIALLDRYGNVLATGTDLGTYSALQFTAADTLYYIAVFAASTGMYSVGWVNQTSTEANNVGQTMSLESAYVASLDYSSDVDRFAFYANEGGRVYFELNSNVYDLFFDVVTADGRFAANLVSSGSGLYYFDPGATGVYILDFSSNSFVAQGSYAFFYTEYVRSILSIFLVEGNDKKAQLLGTLDSTITGNSNNNTLIGNSGSNDLNGLTGSDTLIGGFGNDSYKTDGSDTIVENANEGADAVVATVNYTLGSNLEILVLLGAGALNGTGNSEDNNIAGNEFSNILNGEAGNDTLSGYAGNDTYITDGLDEINEALDGGIDAIITNVSYTLNSNIENLTLTGSALNGTGNALNNVITGNDSANVLSGDLGDDTINASSGIDTLLGGVGDDLYITDGGDTITELAEEGIDTVRSPLSYMLGSNLEYLELTGVSVINGSGNTLANRITGNSAANTLDGGTGVDTLIGGLGSDTYVTDGGDTITEAASAGTDTVRSSVTHMLGSNVENLELTGTIAINGTGNTLSNRLTGNSAANTLSGGSGVDTLIGGSGNDSLNGGASKDLLTGGSGIDQFVFRAASESAASASSADVITDFLRGTDKISLSAIDAFASTLTNNAFVWRGASAFSSTTLGEVRYQKYDNTGSTNDYTMVFIDTDADAGVEMSIRVNGLHSFTSSDFIL